jgi:hypothetical protein
MERDIQPGRGSALLVLLLQVAGCSCVAPDLPDSAVDDTAACITWWYQDLDADGFGDDLTTLQACEQPVGWVDQGGDCDDTEWRVNPDAQETCDGVDNDCDGDIDEDDAADVTTWYPDSDGDGFGSGGGTTISSCEAPGEGWVADDTDCDDTDASVYPGAFEAPCDGVDNDCGGEAEDGAAALDDVEYATIQQAIDAVVGMGTVYICPGEHHEELSYAGDAVLELTSWSGSRDDTVLSGEGSYRVLTVKGEVYLILSHLTLRDGLAVENPEEAPCNGHARACGGAVRFEGSHLRVEDCSFYENSAHTAGAILAYSGRQGEDGSVRGKGGSVSRRLQFGLRLSGGVVRQPVAPLDIAEHERLPASGLQRTA